MAVKTRMEGRHTLLKKLGTETGCQKSGGKCNMRQKSPWP